MSETTTTQRLNDVDLEAVGALVEAIQGDPAKAATTWAAHVTWDGGFRSRSTVRAFDPQPSDEPPALGGGDTAPNPVEQLLAALGNCLAVGYAANATLAGIAIEDLRVDVRGDVDLHAFLGLREGNAGFEGITATVHLETEAPDDAVALLHEKVVGSSPVGHTLGRAVPVDVRLA